MQVNQTSSACLPFYGAHSGNALAQPHAKFEPPQYFSLNLDCEKSLSSFSHSSPPRCGKDFHPGDFRTAP